MYVLLLPLSISIVRVACTLSDSVDDEMSHTSLCNMSVEPARKPAFVSFLCVTPSYASTGHAVASTKAY